VRLRECVDRVIVCDDGSVDLTGEIAEALGAVVVRAMSCMGGFECAVRLGRLSFIGD